VKMKIVVVDARPMLRQGLVSFVSQLPTVEIVGEGSRCSDACEVIRATQPDLVIFDFWLTDGHGVDILRSFREHYEQLKALAYTDDCRPETITAAVASNIQGYVLSTSPPNRLRDALTTISAGRHYMDPVAIDALMNCKPSQALTGRAELTPRELEILSLLREGKGNKEIARRLNVSERTVKFHVSNILRRLDARSRLHAVHLSSEQAAFHDGAPGKDRASVAYPPVGRAPEPA